MSGSSIAFTTTGRGVDVSLGALLQIYDPIPNFAITVRADKNNTSQFNIGRRAAVMPLYGNDSQTFYSSTPEELIFNDLGTSGLLMYVDLSGPMDRRAENVTVHSPGA